MLTFLVVLLGCCALVLFWLGLKSLLNHANLALRAPRQIVTVPEAAEGTVPRPGSRRWARAQYFSGNIGMEELVRFCAEHEERLDDPDR